MEHLSFLLFIIPILIPTILAFNRGIKCFHREHNAGHRKAAAIIDSIFVAIQWWIVATLIVTTLIIGFGYAVGTNPSVGGVSILISALSIIPTFIVYVVTISIIALNSKQKVTK